MTNLDKPELEACKESPQQRFDRTYITATQIMKDLGISRPALLHARRTGKLPGAIEVNDGRLFIWEKESLQPYLSAWKLVLETRRGV